MNSTFQNLIRNKVCILSSSCLPNSVRSHIPHKKSCSCKQTRPSKCVYMAISCCRKFIFQVNLVYMGSSSMRFPQQKAKYHSIDLTPEIRPICNMDIALFRQTTNYSVKINPLNKRSIQADSTRTVARTTLLHNSQNIPNKKKHAQANELVCVYKCIATLGGHSLGYIWTMVRAKCLQFRKNWNQNLISLLVPVIFITSAFGTAMTLTQQIRLGVIELDAFLQVPLISKQLSSIYFWVQFCKV